MKLEVTLAVKPEEFYEVLINSVIEDIRANTEQDIQPFEGFKYKKNLKRYNKSVVATEFEITDLIANELYAFKVITPVEITYVSYQIAEVGNRINVTYIERQESEKARVGASQKLMGAFFGTFFGKRKMKKRFRAIESYIKNK